ncbi:uncharacterized protein LOC115884801 [Sitophilus oryzae]|uniref:Uncharacterized protein LOC115884801 n=1 Tax=Sitophilus oryzae TaxID=7048 RepID=A0A6J2Y810_SITOR|nr:uncharacterized protein LOC115884801 [Sitophilus oryzae]
MMNRLVLLLSLLALHAHAVPVPSSRTNGGQKILYDERQEGDSNIRADLKNIIIFVQSNPSSLSSSTSSPGMSLLNMLMSKANPKFKNVRSKSPFLKTGPETKHFIESKTAPYHVDIGKSDSHLLNDEILATQSPPVALGDRKNKSSTSLLRQLRSVKAFILTVPEDDVILKKTVEDPKVVRKEGLKKKQNKRRKEEMMLIGALEQCGPEMYRDDDGICRMKIGDRDE